MKIKRYEGPERDLPKLILQAKKDLGENMIYDTQTFKKGGMFGIGGQRWVRILAGVEEKSKSNGEDKSPPRQVQRPDVSSKFRDDDIRTERPVMVNVDDSPAIKGILEELRSLKTSIDEIRKKEDEEKTKPEKAPAEVELKGWFEYLRRILEKSGMDRAVARSLVDGVIDITPESEQDDFDRIKARFVEYVASLAVKQSVDVPITETGKSRIIILIGPTGVGKTTTLAKLAANFALLEEKTVSLITADTYRIAAIDQLRTFAQIIDLPLEVVFSPFELKKAIESQKDKDIILVDTAGRSPLDEEKMTELAELLKNELGAEVHLVLSATTKTGDLKAIAKRFKKAGFDKLIISKIDETVTYGPLLEFILDEIPPLSYLTNGQNVPDDIIFAQQKDLIELIAKRAIESGIQTV
jgi:flagellar biosynthesis protein FlhF